MKFNPETIACHRWGGASSGELKPNREAEYIGKPIHGAWLTAYMIRRFGPPNAYSDDHKNLCSWTITTPLKGLALLVTPYLGSPYQGLKPKPGEKPTWDSCLHFGYRYSGELAKAICKAEWKHRGLDKYEARVWKWVQKNKLCCCPLKDAGVREIIWTWDVEDWKNQTKKPAEDRYVVCKPLPVESNSKIYLTKKDFQIPWVYFTLEETYRDTHLLKPSKAKVPTKTFHGYPVYPDCALVHKCNMALRAAIKALFQSVYVRDIYFGVNGNIKDEDVANEKSVPYYKHAGYPCKLAVRPREDA